MKAIRKDIPTTFEPVTIELTIESESELRTLYTKLNMTPTETFNSVSGSKFDVVDASDVANMIDMFDVIESICKERLT